MVNRMGFRKLKSTLDHLSMVTSITMPRFMGQAEGYGSVWSFVIMSVSSSFLELLKVVFDLTG